MQKNNNKVVKVLFASTFDPRSVSTWSGTPRFMSAALERRSLDLEHLSVLTKGSELYFKFVNLFGSIINGRPGLPFQTTRFSSFASRRLHSKISAGSFDLVFCPAGSAIVPAVPDSVPVIYSSDTTFRLMQEYYQSFSGLSAAAIRQADDLERAAISRADLLVYPTQWAAQSAIDDYDADPARVRIVRYGANIAEAPDVSVVMRPVAEAKPFRLLFVGVDWSRKGGPIVLDAFRLLRSRGFDVELTIIGCTPPDPINDTGVRVIPRLDKSDQRQYAMFTKYFLESDLFFLPSRAECYGIVFCEAAAYGLPCLAANTGGVPEIVRHGENGVILPLDAGAERYAEAIASMITDPVRLREMRLKSREIFERELNWDAWARAVAELAAEIVSRRPS